MSSTSALRQRAATAAIALAALGTTAVAAHGVGAAAGDQPFRPNLDRGERVVVKRIPALRPSSFPQPERVGIKEFRAECSVTGTAPDDPIVFPRRPGASHDHTFIGARTTASSTTRRLSRARTSCTVPGDHSSYWFPTMYLGDREVLPEGRQIVYYKAGIEDYDAVRPFPRGLRFVLGRPNATQAEFERDSRVSGWTCGSSGHHYDFPASRERGSSLIVRYKAPSCWDGRHLDVPDHRSHMAYPVDGACPRSHRVAVPMLEYKIAYPVDGDLAGLRLSSGRGFSWHADFFAAWDPRTQAALVTQCINGGGQCDPFGYDQHHPERGRVLDERGRLLRR